MPLPHPSGNAQDGLHDLGQWVSSGDSFVTATTPEGPTSGDNLVATPGVSFFSIWTVEASDAAKHPTVYEMTAPYNQERSLTPSASNDDAEKSFCKLAPSEGNFWLLYPGG